MSRAGTAKFLNVQKCQIRKGPVTVRLARTWGQRGSAEGLLELTVKWQAEMADDLNPAVQVRCPGTKRTFH